jgi:hypothetical protein
MVSRVEQLDLDTIMSRSLYGAAGELQSAMADIDAQRVSEADMRRAVRVALQAQVGRLVTPEHPVPPIPAWKPGLGAFDIAITNENGLLAAVELKWCRQSDKLAEALWDALKLVPYTHDSMELTAYLTYGASRSVWEHAGNHAVELFQSGEHKVLELISRHGADWRWLLSTTKRARPVQLRAVFSTQLIASVPILSATDEPWELRCSRLQALPVQIVFFDENGWPSADQPAFEPPAPASRFIDTAADIQIDAATLPETKALMAALDEPVEPEERPAD